MLLGRGAQIFPSSIGLEPVNGEAIFSHLYGAQLVCGATYETQGPGSEGYFGGWSAELYFTLPPDYLLTDWVIMRNCFVKRSELLNGWRRGKHHPNIEKCLDDGRAWKMLPCRRRRVRSHTGIVSIMPDKCMMLQGF
jgi:hypothetical protein